MGSPERIREVARRVARFANEGHQLVVTPSAMAGETNRLLALARELSQDPSPRELDVIAFTKARIRPYEERRIRDDLAAGFIVIVAGFQGIDDDNNITTLGRGGTDT